ncbi:TadE/TadG family type IV pilus assembly protein [Paenibacillus soyae]|uniref:Pilus assembly protein n=1 Tax=Paenibacillus soyae TaxID=2969249 RepID=A0A9X2MR55_9BACL|nr:TadE family protein [Paenibacillus soyae]MCR2802347.1 pilus assembly protein [Paenibacillus soyae]
MSNGGRLARVWGADERGSFTLESALVFPALLAMVLAFLFVGMYLYQKAVVFYAASVTSERAAFSWDNSNREPVSGMLTGPRYDDLYRRFGSDGALASLFGMNKTDEGSRIDWPGETTGSGGAVENASSQETGGVSSGPRSKLISASEWMASAQLPYNGSAAYAISGLETYIEVKLRHPLEVMPWETSWIRGEPAAAGRGIIVEPVEFVRSVALVRYYTTKFANYPMGKTTARSRAGEVLSSIGQQAQ